MSRNTTKRSLILSTIFQKKFSEGPKLVPNSVSDLVLALWPPSGVDRAQGLGPPLEEEKEEEED